MLIFGSKTISHQEIPSLDLVDFNPFEQKILTIAKDWLSGKKDFFFKTSGSTGDPKEISLSREQILLSVKNTQKALGLKKGFNSLLCISTDFIGGFMMLIRGLEIGMNTTIIEPTSSPLKNFGEDVIFDFSAWVPLQLKETIENYPEKFKVLNNLKALIIGGATVSEDLIAKIQTLKVPIYNTYAMTETVSHIALKRLNGTPDKYFNLNADLKIRQDERGCLVVEGELTNYEPLITNDLVKIISPKEFEWLGRFDQIINSGGYKIFPAKIEHKLELFFRDYKGKIPNYFLGKIPDARLGEAMLLFVEGLENNQLKMELLSYLKKELPKYEVPKSLAFVEKFNYTESSKVDRLKTIHEYKLSLLGL